MPVLSSRPLDYGPSDPELAAAGIPDTSPTWELELLISGAVLFALFQIPALLTSFFSRLEPHATATMMTVLLLGQMYVKAMVYALIASFVVHLVARAYWVGLVGLHSVFPKGVNWENYKSGPLTLEVYKARLLSLPAVISRIDNFCSMIFSFAFLLVILFAFTVIFCGLLGALAYGISHVFLGGTQGDNVFMALAALTAIVPAATATIDRRYGATLGPRGQRWLKRMIVVLYRGTSQSVISPIFIPLLTNVGRTKIRAIFFTSLFGILFVVMAERFARQDVISVNSYDYFAASDRFGVNYRFYESERASDEPYERTPSIQSDVISGPYVKLFIPYLPRRDNAIVAKSCPALRPIQGRGLQFGPDTPIADSVAIPVLQCLARLHAVTLDGSARADVQFRFYEHPATGIKGILTYLPADSLARGQHTLTVLKGPAPAGAWVIPFWR